jgi:hypothetical protein
MLAYVLAEKCTAKKYKVGTLLTFWPRRLYIPLFCHFFSFIAIICFLFRRTIAYTRMKGWLLFCESLLVISDRNSNSTNLLEEGFLLESYSTSWGISRPLLTKLWERQKCG